MSERIECKPTQWFLFRALGVLLIFGIFAVMFYKDGKFGYREENLSYYTFKAVEKAVQQFESKKSQMSPAEWRKYAASQTIDFPDNPELLPADLQRPVPWPEILQDYDTMEKGAGNWSADIFDVHRGKIGMEDKAPEKPHTALEIDQQWWIFWLCLAVVLLTLFFLVRTLSRKMVLEGDRFQPAGGRPVNVTDLVRLDLRKWGSKGIAMAWAKIPNGKERKIRIDGLTYGGFNKERGEPAEMLMQAIRNGFSGEYIEYEEEVPDSEQDLENSKSAGN